MKARYALLIMATATVTTLVILAITQPVGLKTWSAYEVLTASDLNNNFAEILGVLNDTTNARKYTSFPLWWTQAYGDSIASNDTLTVHIVKDSPIGDAQGLFIQNDNGVAETIALYLDFVLPNAIGILDSIRIPVWTEAVSADSDYVAFSVWDDSTATSWKSKLTANATDSLSSTKRTAKTARITDINLTGGKIRLKAIVKTVSDSAFVGTPIVYVRNP